MSTSDCLFSNIGSAETEEIEGKPRVVFILGGPGAGKGTQCGKLTTEFRRSIAWRDTVENDNFNAMVFAKTDQGGIHCYELFCTIATQGYAPSTLTDLYVPMQDVSPLRGRPAACGAAVNFAQQPAHMSNRVLGEAG